MLLVILFNFLLQDIRVESNFPDPDISGLWEITNVKAGEDEMTPMARWVRLNPDHTQQSGNGWKQHSVGTWNYNEKTNELTIVNTNGFRDPYDPFKVAIDDSGMRWERLEDGLEVVVYLKRIDKLPESPADMLLGVWRLESSVHNNADHTKSIDPEGNNTLFLHWDNIFSEHDGTNRTHMGVYKAHGHKQEVELIYYGDDCRREWWEFKFTNNELQMVKLNSDDRIVNSYTRVDRFPD